MTFIVGTALLNFGPRAKNFRRGPPDFYGKICSSLFKVFMDRIGVEVHKLAKEEQSQYFQPCDRTSMVNKGFITWLSGKGR